MNDLFAITDPGLHARFKLRFADFQLDVELKLPGKGVSVLFGHSGSGKTSLLRCIAGLERAQSGELWVSDQCWQSATEFVPPHQRPIGYVFQEASLFPHLTAQGNLDYARKRAPNVRRPIDMDQAISLLGIETLLQRKPAQLSGGERQRIAIARALLIQPQLLLMDEPLAALDLPRKQEILPYLENLKHALDLPIIYVSHAADEVARLADHLVVMENGKILTSGPLTETLSQLDLPLKLGEETGVVLEGRVIERDYQWHLARIAFDGGEVWLRDGGHAVDSQVRVRILARDVSLSTEPAMDTSIVNSLAAEVTAISNDDHPALALVRLRVGNSYLVSRVTRRSAETLKLAPGKVLWAQVKSVAVL